MQRSLLIAVVAAFVFTICGDECLAQSAVATPAIDTSIFKDGAVEDKHFRFYDWAASCRQIVKIKKRVCNLLSNVVNYRGNAEGSVIIASTDTGIPAMMIALSHDLTEGKPIAVRASSIGRVDGKVVKVEFETTTRPMICDTSCKYMFPLDSRLIFILNAGDAVSIASPAQDEPKEKPRNDRPKQLIKSFTISGRGFADALSQSTKVW
ncbi:hypothetical protein [Methylobacterium komagatae]